MPYTNGGLFAFNVVYNNGGGAVHIFSSEYVTAANNTVYNSQLDTKNTGTGRAMIDTNGSWGDTVINNVSYAICGSGILTNNSAIGPYGPGSTQTTTLKSAITSSATSLTLASASAMPGGSAGYAQNNSYTLPGGNMIQVDNEIMLVTAGWSTTTLTVERGYQGTTPAAHSSSATVTWVPDYFSNNVTYATSPCTDGSTSTFSGDVYPLSQNRANTLPGWVDVGGIGGGSAGTEMTPPSATNFALEPGSPAIGYGMTAGFLPPSSVDAGACSSALATCP